MEIVNYENKPVPSVAKDFWRRKVATKGKPPIKGQALSYQGVNIIVQYFSSNYVPPHPKKKQ